MRLCATITGKYLIDGGVFKIAPQVRVCLFSFGAVRPPINLSQVPAVYIRVRRRPSHCLTPTHKVEMANTESDIAVTTDKKVEESDQVDKKELSEEEKVVAPEAQPKPKRLWLERLILCVALFFPLFLATLDTSIHPK
jgi:hypothetical protein